MIGVVDDELDVVFFGEFQGVYDLLMVCSIDSVGVVVVDGVWFGVIGEGVIGFVGEVCCYE